MFTSELKMSTLLRSINFFKINQISHIRFQSSLASKSSGHYDVIIAGGGLVGTSLLLSLGNFTKLNFSFLMTQRNFS